MEFARNQDVEEKLIKVLSILFWKNSAKRNQTSTAGLQVNLTVNWVLIITGTNWV